MNQNREFNSKLYQSYINKLRTEKDTNKKREIKEAISSWLHWLKSKEKISHSRYQSLLHPLESETIDQKKPVSEHKHQDGKKYPLYLYIYTLLLFVSISLNIYTYITLSHNVRKSSDEPTGRVLPFRGTIKETDGSPLDTKRDAVFNLYSTQGGETPLYRGSCTGENGIEPSFNGSFSILIGADCDMEPIPEEIFNSNSTLYLGVKIGSEPELSPRYQIFTSSFSKDTSKLQGLNLGTSASSIPFINENGELVIDTDSPTIKSTNGIFTIEGGSITISTVDEGGDIIIDPALGGSVIVGSGRFGVGTFDPKGTFDVTGSSILENPVHFSNLTTEDSPGTGVLKLNLGTIAEGESSEFISFYAGVGENNPGSKVGSIRLSNNAVAYETSGADFAEYFPVKDITLFETSQIVSLTDKGMIPAVSNGNVIGVISESPGFIGNIKDKGKSILVGMVGQVDVLVSTINGDITVGDKIGTSDIPGYGMKSTDVKNKIGIALEKSEELSFTNESCPVYFRHMPTISGERVTCGKLRIVINLN